MQLITVEPGNEVIDLITRRCAELGITNGAIVSLIGAVDTCQISNMSAIDADDNVFTDYNQPLELTGTGEIIDGKPHIHCTVTGEGNAAFGGHLHRATVDSHFVHVYLDAI